MTTSKQERSDSTAKKLNAALQSEDISEEPQVLSAAFETGPYFQSHCTR